VPQMQKELKKAGVPAEAVTVMSGARGPLHAGPFLGMAG